MAGNAMLTIVLSITISIRLKLSRARAIQRLLYALSSAEVIVVTGFATISIRKAPYETQYSQCPVASATYALLHRAEVFNPQKLKGKFTPVKPLRQISGSGCSPGCFR